MAQLIDTSVFIALDRQRASLDAFEAMLDGEPFAIASITASELLVGAFKTVPAQQERSFSFVETVLDRVPALPFDLESARTHARLFVELSATGQMIGANDLVIAATALTHNYSVLTHNLRHFERIPGLVVNAPDWWISKSRRLTGALKAANRSVTAPTNRQRRNRCPSRTRSRPSAGGTPIAREGLCGENGRRINPIRTSSSC